MINKFKSNLKSILIRYPYLYKLAIFSKSILKKVFRIPGSIYRKSVLLLNQNIIIPIVSRNQIKHTRKEFLTKQIAKEPDTVALYRILGNDLPPRHISGQTYSNLKFILKNEIEFENCQKIWILNRIKNKKELEKLKHLLEKYSKEYVSIPFVTNEYEKYGFIFNGLDDAGIIYREPKNESEKVLKSTVNAYVVSQKNRYAINNNGARNIALEHGKQGAKWVMPWDGNCFLTENAWNEIMTGLKEKPWMKYFIVPMARIINNDELLSGDFSPIANEEPQIIFRKDARESFNELYPYGRMPKVELLKKLGVPGVWQKWKIGLHKWDVSKQVLSKEKYQYDNCGWVARLNSGNTNAEHSSLERKITRERGIVEFLKLIDLSLIKEKFVSNHNSYYGKSTFTTTKENLDFELNPKERFVHKLTQKAKTFLKNEPYSVVKKTTLPPGGDIHDYWHPAPYFWPNPKSKDGLPYLYKDGVRVPGTLMYETESKKYDRTSIQRMFDETTILALAYNSTSDSKYAKKASVLIRTWFINEETMMNPHLKYAQVKMGLNSNKGTTTGIIETKDFYFFLDAVRMISNSEYWSNEDDYAMKKWCNAFLIWLLKSDMGKQEKEAKNNHGLLYDLQTASIAGYLEDLSLLYDISKTASARLIDHIDKDGIQPHEMKRTTSFHYCTFNLQSWINLAIVLDNTIGFDLWNFSCEGKGSIEKALNWLLPYYNKQWPYKQIDKFDKERLVPLYHLSKSKYPAIAKKYKDVFPDIDNLQPYYHPHDGIPVYWVLNVDH